MLRIKICGITRVEDGILAFQLGAWALGFIFYRKSPRYIDFAAAAKVIAAVRPSFSNRRFVGVFVNPTLSEVEAGLKAGITTVQLHGDETPEFCQKVGGEVIKVLRLKDETDLEQVKEYENCVRYFLIDAAVSGAYGGTGQLANWELVKQMQTAKPVILSGGLGAGNIVQAARQVKPFAADLSSSVEEAPSIKSHDLLRELFTTLNKEGLNV